MSTHTHTQSILSALRTLPSTHEQSNRNTGRTFKQNKPVCATAQQPLKRQLESEIEEQNPLQDRTGGHSASTACATILLCASGPKMVRLRLLHKGCFTWVQLPVTEPACTPEGEPNFSGHGSAKTKHTHRSSTHCLADALAKFKDVEHKESQIPARKKNLKMQQKPRVSEKWNSVIPNESVINRPSCLTVHHHP